MLIARFPGHLRLLGRIESKVIIAKRNLTNKCIVYLTTCDNPFYNLAFEEWMYDKVDLKTTKCMFLWRSQPSVVIGRHQNTWSECNIRHIRENDVYLARRQSGGGTVYHDAGNLNLTFFTNRKRYDRRENLEVVVNALCKWRHLDLDINCKDDIIMSGKYKVSGSSSKLGRNNAYHHCTLLYNADLGNISKFLEPSLDDLETKATASVRSATANLSSISFQIDHEMLKDALITEYFSSNKLIASKHGYTQEQIVANIDPRDESMFPGISDIYSRLKSWDWVYAKSPRFSIERSFDDSRYGKTIVRLTVVNGMIDELSITTNFSEKFIRDLEKFLLGCKFTTDNIREKLIKFQNDSLALLNISDKEYIKVVSGYIVIMLEKT